MLTPLWGVAGRSARWRRAAAGGGLGGEPALTLGVQVAEVWPCDDHAVEDCLQLSVGLQADRLNLPLVAVAASLLDEEGAQGGDVALAEHRAQALDVVAVA